MAKQTITETIIALEAAAHEAWYSGGLVFSGLQALVFASAFFVDHFGRSGLK